MSKTTDLVAHIKTAIRARQPAVWVKTYEPLEAQYEVTRGARECTKNKAHISVWTARNVLTKCEPSENFSDYIVENVENVSYGQAVAELRPSAPVRETETRVLILQNPHLVVCPSVGGNSVVQPQAAAILLEYAKRCRDHAEAGGLVTVIVFLCPPDAKIPTEIAPMFLPVTHELPTVKTLAAIAESVADKGENAPEDYYMAAAQAARGLTAIQAENVFGLSAARTGSLDPAFIWKTKADILSHGGFVTLHSGGTTFDDVKGCEGLKRTLKALLANNPYADKVKGSHGRGIILAGPPGTGKTFIAQALGNETNRPTLVVNPGQLMGKYVGETEANTAKLFQIINAMAPCVVFIDEIAKVMPQNTSKAHEVSARMFGSFLGYMNDVEENVFFVFAENSEVRNLHSAFSRAGRIDFLFYVHLPSRAERATIWEKYGQEYFPVDDELGENRGFYDLMNVGQADGAEAYVERVRTAAKNWKGTDSEARRLLHPLALSLLSLPDEDAQTVVDNIGLGHLAKLMKRTEGVDLEAVTQWLLPATENWSPAEIKACCRLACRLNVDLKEAAMGIRPVATTDSEQIEEMEKWAKTFALDATTGRQYSESKTLAESSGRRRRTLS